MYRDKPESEIVAGATKSFEKKFRVIDGEYFFSVGRTKWMLPVSEEEYQTARDRVLLLTKAFKISYYAAWAVAVAYSFYLIFVQDRYLPLLYAWLGYFAFVAILSIFAQTLPTQWMWQRLRMGLQLADEEKPRMLRVKPKAAVR